jgi:transposase
MRESGGPTQILPDDPAALQALLLAAWAERDRIAAERDSLAVERDALAARNERLQHLLRKLQRMQFGPRSERLPEDQLQFAFEEVEASLASNEAEAEKRSPDLRQKKAARVPAQPGARADSPCRVVRIA